MQEREILTLSDLNLAEAAREMARWHKDYRIEESDDLLLVAGADPFPAGYGKLCNDSGHR